MNGHFGGKGRRPRKTDFLGSVDSVIIISPHTGSCSPGCC